MSIMESIEIINNKADSVYQIKTNKSSYAVSKDTYFVEQLLLSIKIGTEITNEIYRYKETGKSRFCCIDH